MWQTIVESLLIAVRLLAPAALIAWLCGQDSALLRLFHNCDRAVRTALFPKKRQSDTVTKWLQEMFPNDERVASLDAVWSNGSVVCDIVELAIPGSCTGHAPNDHVDMSHGQRLAERYLGVRPVFNGEELHHKVLNTYQEYKLTTYLCDMRNAISQLNPPVSRTGAAILNFNAYTLDYVARGMGLVAATENQKSTFYIYPTAQQGLEPGDISVQIKGPNAVYGSALVAAVYGRTHIVRSVLANLEKNPHRRRAIIVADGGKRSKVANDIEVNVVVRNDRVRVTYVPTAAGRHELSLITKGCHLIGSPFGINVDAAVSAHLLRRKLSYDEDDPICEPDRNKRAERKIVFRIVDFVTEKMLLNEDGTLERISDERAKQLLHRAESADALIKPPSGRDRFIAIAKRIILLLHICKQLYRPAKPDIINIAAAHTLRQKYKDKHASFNRTDDEYSETPSVEIIITSFEDDDAIINESDNGRNLEIIDRPKTPIIKILEEDTNVIKDDEFHGFDPARFQGQFDSLNMFEKESERPVCETVIDFHIGAPVTPTPNMPANLDVVDMDSIILAPNLEEALRKYDSKVQYCLNDAAESNVMTDSEIVQLYEAPPREEIESGHIEEVSPPAEDINVLRNETWDSAYVSIDDIHTSPETNSSSPRSESSKLYNIEEAVEGGEKEYRENFYLMGPAEREIWQNEILNEESNTEAKARPFHIPVIKECEECMDDLPTNDSASDIIADAKRSDVQDVGILSVRSDAELQDISHDAAAKSPSPTTKRNMSKMVSQKKEYWDEKIQSIREEEAKVKRVLGDKSKTTHHRVDQPKRDENSWRNDHVDYVASETETEMMTNEKLVEKWKKYWDERIENTPTPEADLIYVRKISTKTNADVCPNGNEMENRAVIESFPDQIVKFEAEAMNESWTDAIMGKNVVAYRSSDIIAPVYQTEKLEVEVLPEIFIMAATPIPENSDNLSIEDIIDVRHEETAVECGKVERSKTDPTDSLQRSQCEDSPCDIGTVIKDDENEENSKNNDNKREMKQSIEAEPSLAEKKAAIEQHLKQRCDTKSRDDAVATLNSTDKQSRKNFDASANETLDVQTEMKQLAKPIKSIVAIFENKTADSTMEKNYSISKRVKLNKALPYAVEPEDTAKRLEKKIPVVEGCAVKKFKCPPVKNSLIEDEFITSLEKYKCNVKKAKEFFQNMNLKKEKSEGVSKSPNECETLLIRAISERSVESKNDKTIDTKNSSENIQKAFSVSDIQSECDKYFIKMDNDEELSKKYLVNNLFRDILGSNKDFPYGHFKGIPHKEAVIAAFNAISNVGHLSPYYDYTRKSIDTILHMEEKKINNELIKSEQAFPIRKDFLKLQHARRNSVPNFSSIN